MWNPNSLMELKLKSTICHVPRDFQPGPFPSSVAKISLRPDQHRRSGHCCRQVTHGGERARMRRWELRTPRAVGPPERESSSPRPHCRHGRSGGGSSYLQSPSSRSSVPFMSRMRLARAGTGCMARSSSSQRATSAYMARMLRSAASPRLSTPSR